MNGDLGGSRSTQASREPYAPVLVATDGWKPVQAAWKVQVPSITLIECNLHGRKRVDVTLAHYAKAHPKLSPDERRQLETEFDSIFATPTLAAFSQRIRGPIPVYSDKPIWLNRLHILSQRSLSYEFCIPADENHWAQVRRIDPSVQVSRSPGRIGCTKNQYLVIGDTHQPGWQTVLKALSRLNYIQRIDEFIGE
jgi:hypothetical protein